MKIIFDFGCHKGQNFEYFFNKADIIVAVEANPILAEDIKKKYKNEINEGRLILENKAISSKNKKSINFYISKKDSVLSQIEYPKNIKKFKKIKTQCISARSLINKYCNKYNITNPYYIKIDVERHDAIILNDILNNRILPNYMSCEAHDPEVIRILLKSPYKSFKVIEGLDIGTKIRNINILDRKVKN